MKKNLFVIVMVSVIMLISIFTAAYSVPHPMEPQPKVVSALENKVPSDAIVLFDGSDLSEWTDTEGKASNWEVSSGAMIVNKGAVMTRREFGDIQLHLEFATPEIPTGDGQDRGNSGIYFNGVYEVQVLDSYNNKTYINGQCGAIYENFPPLVNVSRPPGQWQEYDIIFRAPRYNQHGTIIQKPILTVFHNGVLIQDHVHTGVTPGGLSEGNRAKGPIFLQDHAHPVKYRNIWVRELK